MRGRSVLHRSSAKAMLFEAIDVEANDLPHKGRHLSKDSMWISFYRIRCHRRRCFPLPLLLLVLEAIDSPLKARARK